MKSLIQNIKCPHVWKNLRYQNQLWLHYKYLKYWIQKIHFELGHPVEHRRRPLVKKASKKATRINSFPTRESLIQIEKCASPSSYPFSTLWQIKICSAILGFLFKVPFDNFFLAFSVLRQKSDYCNASNKGNILCSLMNEGSNFGWWYPTIVLLLWPPHWSNNTQKSWILCF